MHRNGSRYYAPTDISVFVEGIESGAYGKTIHGALASMGLRREDREDIEQDTYLKLLCHFERYDPSSDIRPFLSRMAKNTAIDRFRRTHAERQWVPLEDALYVSVHGTQEHDVITNQELAMLDAAMKTLSDRDHQILDLVLDDWTGSEIARATKLPEGTVKTIIHRAKARIRENIRR